MGLEVKFPTIIHPRQVHLIVFPLPGNAFVGSMDYKCCHCVVFKDKGIFLFCVDMVVAKLYFGTILTGISPYLFCFASAGKSSRGGAAPGSVVAGVA